MIFFAKAKSYTKQCKVTDNKSKDSYIINRSKVVLLVSPQTEAHPPKAQLVFTIFMQRLKVSSQNKTHPPPTVASFKTNYAN